MFETTSFRLRHLGHKGVERHFLSEGVFCRQCQKFSLHEIPDSPKADATVADYANYVRSKGFWLMITSPMTHLAHNCKDPQNTLVSAYRAELARRGSDIVLVHHKTTFAVTPSPSQA